jgi:transcription antitermination factor NusG
MIHVMKFWAQVDIQRDVACTQKGGATYRIRKEQTLERLYTDKHILSDARKADWLEPKWHVLFVKSNQEKRVVQHLSSRQIDHFLPAYESVRQRKDRKVKLLSPLFPGYVFVRLSLADRLKVLLVPNVVNLVGTGKAPSIVSDEEIDSIRRGIAHGKAEPYPYLKAGDTVMIKQGVLAGLQGILIRVANGTRVLIRLDSICRAFGVEVDSSWVEPVRAKPILSYAC